jgi:Fungal Zn(2)-Cys(6) binuclear cluster domain
MDGSELYANGNGNHADDDSIEGSPPPSSNANGHMAGMIDEDDHGHGGSAGGNGPKLRKRTKTGCLTCRKRRIKCGEERPICNNCVKSKRHCEGYNQRIVFKSPTGWTMMGGAPSYPIPYHTSAVPGAPPGSTVYYDVQPHFGIPLDEHGRPIPMPPLSAPLREYAGASAQYPLPQFSPIPPEISHTNGAVPIQPGQQYPPQPPYTLQPSNGFAAGLPQFNLRSPPPTQQSFEVRTARESPSSQPLTSPDRDVRMSESPYTPQNGQPYAVHADQPYNSVEPNAGFSETEPHIFPKQSMSRNFTGMLLES